MAAKQRLKPAQSSLAVFRSIQAFTHFAACDSIRSPAVPTLSPCLRQFFPLPGHLLFELCAALFGDCNEFGAVSVVWVKLLKQCQVVLPEALGVLPGMVRRLAQQLQYAARAPQAGLKQLPLDPHHAAVA